MAGRFLPVFAVLAASVQMASAQSKDFTHAEVKDGINNAIAQGSTLWNHGNVDACVKIYKDAVSLYSIVDVRLGAALSTAAHQPATHAGWTLRGAMDAVLHTIAIGGELITPALAQEEQTSGRMITMSSSSTTSSLPQYTLQEVAAAIDKALEVGVPLWNSHEVAACVAIYMQTCERFAHMDERLKDAVEHAERQSTQDAGWTLRHGMDAVLHEHHSGGQLQLPSVSIDSMTTKKQHPTCPDQEHDGCCSCKSDEFLHGDGDWDNGSCCGHCSNMCNAVLPKGNSSSSSANSNEWWASSPSWSTWGSAADTYEGCATCNDDDDATTNDNAATLSKMSRAMLGAGVGLIVLGMIMVVAIRTPSLWGVQAAAIEHDAGQRRGAQRTSTSSPQQQQQPQGMEYDDEMGGMQLQPVCSNGDPAPRYDDARAMGGALPMASSPPAYESSQDYAKDAAIAV